ncbi:MAG: hypothetical protein KKC18_10775 [Chloroflexi bacterium]|nr:hypothetical protein [Chloroflexota bacterium]
MTTISDNLERELGEFYAHVPPHKDLTAGREQLLLKAACLKAQTGSLSTRSLEIEKPQRRKMRLLLKAVAAVMAVVVGAGAIGGGAVLASADSLPGAALYPVKLAVEDTRLALTTDPAAQAELTMAFTAERAEEMQRLVAQGEPVPEEVIYRMAQHTEQVLTQIAQARPEEITPLLEQVIERTNTQQQVLEQVRSYLPEETQPALHYAIRVMERVRQAANDALGDPQRFQEEYQYRYYEGTPGPHREVTPSRTPMPPGAIRTPQQNQGQDQYGGGTPAGTPQQDQDQDQDRDRDMTCTPTCTPQQDQDQDQGSTDTPTSVPQDQDQDQDRDQDQDQDRLHTQEPTPTLELGGGHGGSH